MNNEQQFLQLIKRQNRAVIYNRILVSFDGINQPYEALVDLSDRWNGWLKPFILHTDVERMLNDSGVKWSMNHNATIIINHSEDYETLILLEQLNGLHGYHFGNLGWVFEKYNHNR